MLKQPKNSSTFFKNLKSEKKPLFILEFSPIRADQVLTSTEILSSEGLSSWVDTPVKLLQVLFQVSIDGCGLFKIVVPSSSDSKADLLLESSLLDFSHHVNDNGFSEGLIRMHFYLIDNTTKTVTGAKEIVSNVLITTNNTEEAFKEAAINVACDLIFWLADLRKR
jgi:cholesterol transport system auxiliary component